MPVRLREGGRTVGGAMSWGEPKALAPFPEGSPFSGWRCPPMWRSRTGAGAARPGTGRAHHRRAGRRHAAGDPQGRGAGQVVLVHVTANAEWSTLPLSGLFVQMLERLAVSTTARAAGSWRIWPGRPGCRNWCWTAMARPADAGELAGVEGEAWPRRIADGPDAALPPGLYARADRRVALNVIGRRDRRWRPRSGLRGPWSRGWTGRAAQALKGALLALALVLLLARYAGGAVAVGAVARAWRAAAAVLASGLLLPQASAGAETLRRRRLRA